MGGNFGQNLRNGLKLPPVSTFKYIIGCKMRKVTVKRTFKRAVHDNKYLQLKCDWLLNEIHVACNRATVVTDAAALAKGRGHTRTVGIVACQRTERA